MRIWTTKDAAEVLDIHRNSVTGALDPALVKIAKLFMADPVRTLDEILMRVRELELEIQKGSDGGSRNPTESGGKKLARLAKTDRRDH